MITGRRPSAPVIGCAGAAYLIPNRSVWSVLLATGPGTGLAGRIGDSNGGTRLKESSMTEQLFATRM